MIVNDFLYQNGLSEEDGKGWCPMYKTVGMMRCIYRFDLEAEKAIESHTTITWDKIEEWDKSNLKCIEEINKMKKQNPDPNMHDQQWFTAYFDKLCNDIKKSFNDLRAKHN